MGFPHEDLSGLNRRSELSQYRQEDDNTSKYPWIHAFNLNFNPAAKLLEGISGKSAASYWSKPLTTNQRIHTFANFIAMGFTGKEPGIGIAAKGGTTVLDGSFSVTKSGWRGYPTGGIKLTGPYRLLEGAEYTSARNLANSTNAAMRRANPEFFKGLQIHEIHPVKFGGSLTDLSNKIFLTPSRRAQYTNFWNVLMRGTK